MDSNSTQVPRSALAAANLVAALIALFALASSASAASFQRPLKEVFGTTEQPSFSWPSLLAVEPSTGDVLVGDRGEGEIQQVTISATGGTFALGFEGKTTSDLAYNASPRMVSEALEVAVFGSVALRENFVVTGGPGDEAGSAPYMVRFNAKLNNRDVEQLECVDGSTPLSGGSGCSVTTTRNGVSQSLNRFHPNGTPAPFGALGTNVIDGIGRGPCSYPPTPSPNCDKTPEDGLEISGGARQQAAVDPVTGDIYLTSAPLEGEAAVEIFSAEGKYLGQLTSSIKGALNEPCGVAIDSSGAVYVASQFGGHFGTIGIAKFVPGTGPPTNADNTAVFPIEGQQGERYEKVCHMAMGTGPSSGSIFIAMLTSGTVGPHVFKVDKETGEFHEFASGFNELVTVDPTNGNPIMAGAGGNKEFVEFDGSGETAGPAVSRMFVELGLSGAGDITAAASGEVYAVVGSQAPQVYVYGLPARVPGVTVEPATEVTGTKATLEGMVNPEDLEVSECFFEWGKTTQYGERTNCKEMPLPTDSEPHSVSAALGGLEPNGQTYHVRVVAKNENGVERSVDQTFTTAFQVRTEAAAATGSETAGLEGTVRPEGVAFSDCSFEYGIAANPGYEESATCSPDAGEIGADFNPHEVSAAIDHLQAATTYRYRVRATPSGGATLYGKEMTFETFGPPRVTEPGARDAGRSSVTIEAKVDPRGFGTKYHFEWGPTRRYGYRLPGTPASLGEGQAAIRVSAEVAGLEAGTTYHFRVIATSDGGAVASPDQTFETLNSCGLPEGRCFELVSRRDAGPVAAPGRFGFVNTELRFQAAESGPGALAYGVENGYPDARKGTEVSYLARRGANGWESSLLGVPALIAPHGSKENPGSVVALSPDLSCGVVESNQPLTDDASMGQIVDAGGDNLYRRNPDGSYTGITTVPPEDLSHVRRSGTIAYPLVGISRDCAKVVFDSSFSYPGVTSVGEGGLYEWDEGQLRGVGFVPAPGGEAAVKAAAGVGNGVSDDGSRVFFTAERRDSPNPEEIGAQGIFVREDGTTTHDLSLSQTTVPDTGADYEYATPDGAHVFFTANPGLASNGASSEGTDLYRYDLAGGALTDLSVGDEAGGARVAGFIGASEDGTTAYFVARGQLLPGRGRTLAENQADDSYSIYVNADGALGFVGTVAGAAINSQGLIVSKSQTSRVSPDGSYLLFESVANVTGYDSGGAAEAYLFDAATGTTVCLSCREDGKAPFLSPGTPALPAVGSLTSYPNPPRKSLLVRGGQPLAFFYSLDSLAPGAREGEYNVYEWSHGQVFLLTSEPPGSRFPEAHAGETAVFAGASADGSDVYVASVENLSWEDGDERPSVYDSRVGGGFPEPPPPAAPCDPASEGSCSGPSQTAVPARGAASTSFVGPGNVKAKKRGRGRKHKTRHKRHHGHHHKRRHRSRGNSRRQRHANAGRRAGK